MLIFGAKDLPTLNFFSVESVEDIKKSSPKDIVLLDSFNSPYELAKYCQANEVAYAVDIANIKEAVFASNLGASFIICSFELAKELQKVADNYLWDTKVLAKISSEDEIEEVALAGVDGAILEAESSKHKAKS